MDQCFTEPPKSVEEVGLRLDYLRSEGRIGGGTTIGEAATLVGTSSDRVADSKRFYQEHRRET